MPLKPITREAIKTLLFRGSNSFRDIARRYRVSDSTVRAIAIAEGIVDPDPKPNRRKSHKRCKNGHLLGRRKSCPICEANFKDEVKRRRRALERRLREDPTPIDEWSKGFRVQGSDQTPVTRRPDTRNARPKS